MQVNKQALFPHKVTSDPEFERLHEVHSGYMLRSLHTGRFPAAEICQ